MRARPSRAPDRRAAPVPLGGRPRSPTRRPSRAGHPATCRGAAMAALKACRRAAPALSRCEPASRAMRSWPCSTRWSTRSAIPPSLSSVTAPSPVPAMTPSKKIAGVGASDDGSVENGARHPRARHQQPVDLMREQRLECGELPVDVETRIHQHHAVAGLLEPALGSFERGCVERAGDVRHDESDGEGLLRAQRPCERRRLEVELCGRVLHGGAGRGCEAAVAVQGPRGGRRRDAGLFGDVGKGHRPTAPNDCASDCDAAILALAVSRSDPSFSGSASPASVGWAPSTPECPAHSRSRARGRRRGPAGATPRWGARRRGSYLRRGVRTGRRRRDRAGRPLRRSRPASGRSAEVGQAPLPREAGRDVPGRAGGCRDAARPGQVVQVGYMRRYDARSVEARASSSGAIRREPATSSSAHEPRHRVAPKERIRGDRRFPPRHGVTRLRLRVLVLRRRAGRGVGRTAGARLPGAQPLGDLDNGRHVTIRFARRHRGHARVADVVVRARHPVRGRRQRGLRLRATGRGAA